MATATLESAFILGEVSPSLFGRFDLARLHVAASTMRNMWPSFRGGAYSRAGTAFVGFSKQTGRVFPPRLITFQFSISQGLALEFGNFYMRVIINGAFVTEAPVNITSISNANPGVLVMSSDAFVTGDWVFLASVGGMTQVNGQTYVLTRTSAAHYTLHDVYGNNIDTTAFGAFTAGGTAARIYTLATIYGEADVAWLKVTESADVMSICCVNQQTGTEYPPQDLSRITDSNWSFSPVVPAPSVLPPNAAPTVTPSTAGTVTYAYQITSVSPTDGTESVASATGIVATAVNIMSTAGTINVVWPAVAGVSEYNIYKAEPAVSFGIPAGALFGFCGSAYGTNFNDTNIIPDFSQVPPQHINPFARGQIIRANVTGSSGTVTSVTFTITTGTGSGALLQGVVIGNALVAILVEDAGENYLPGDTVTVNVTGGGAATATLTIGALTGTYPGTVAYFQERRAYAFTLNNPDTYFMSQPGAFTNFDVRTPPIDSDAITGSPWATQVNGIQFMIQTSGGLLVFTGLQCWLLVGAGSFATNVQAISPSSQLVNPQPAVGCSPTLQPIKINYDVIFADAFSTYYYDLPYQLYALSEPISITINSTHLFTGYFVQDHTWCERPNRLLWSVRDDGCMVSLTYLKSEQVASYARHDTNGLFFKVCSVAEGQTDALYLVVQRVIGATNMPFIIERMDNRIWTDVEHTWCVDCGFSLPQPTPNATLTISPVGGQGVLDGATGIVPGGNYSAGTLGVVIDAPLTPDGPPGPGSGAVPTLTFVGGGLATVNFGVGQQGNGYVNPKLVITDPAGSAGGSGASAILTLDNSAAFHTTAPAFTSIGQVIRAFGGVAVITTVTDSQNAIANVLTPFTAALQPNSNPPSVQALGRGEWSLTTPVSSVYIPQLAGATVTGLLDGNVLAPTAVPANGVLVLPKAASQVTIGFGFQAQLQSVYLDVPGQGGTVQAQRKKIAAANVLLEASRGVKMGSNQVDGSTLSPLLLAPVWSGLSDVPDMGIKAYNSNTIPLGTGYQRVPVQGGFQKPGQVCLQQDNPLPMNVLALVPETLEGDTPSQGWPQRQPQQQKGA